RLMCDLCGETETRVAKRHRTADLLRAGQALPHLHDRPNPWYFTFMLRCFLHALGLKLQDPPSLLHETPGLNADSLGPAVLPPQLSNSPMTTGILFLGKAFDCVVCGST